MNLQRKLLALTEIRDRVPSVGLAAFVNLKAWLPHLSRRGIDGRRIPKAPLQMQGASLPSGHSEARASRLVNGKAMTDEKRPRKMTRREKAEETMSRSVKMNGKSNSDKNESAWPELGGQCNKEERKRKAPGWKLRTAGVLFYSARQSCSNRHFKNFFFWLA
jgi:hypothetical protein